MSTRLRIGQARTGRRRSARTVWLALSVATLCSAFAAPSAAQSEPFRTVEGLSVYLGVIPAAMMQHQLKTGTGMALHGGPPPGEHAYHVTVAVFDAASGERVQDVGVRARVSGLGLSGPEKKLDPMTIADTVTYGNYFIMPPNDTYRVQVEIRRLGQAEPVRTEFVYDHRLR
jgi:hypothetical protein